MMSRKTKSKLITSLLEILLFVCISFIIIVPLLIMVLGSFKDRQPRLRLFYLELPKQWLFENYVTVFEEADLGTALFNGILITVVSTAVTIGGQFPGGVCCGEKKDPRLSRFLYYFFFIGTIIPMQTIPTIRLFSALGIYGSDTNAILLYVAMNISFSCFLYTGIYQGNPQSVLTRRLLLTVLRQ